MSRCPRTEDGDKLEEVGGEEASGGKRNRGVLVLSDASVLDGQQVAYVP